MKRSLTIGITILAVVLVAAGGVAILRMPSKPASPTTASASSATTASAAILVTKTDSNLGKYLAEPSGLPLYTYGGDSNGVSNCTGSCLATWPAYQDKDSTANLPAGVGTIKRADNGETQFTYNGLPLYTFASDTSGQVTGNGVANFTVAKPASSSTTSSSQPASSSSTAAPASSNSSSSASGSDW